MKLDGTNVNFFISFIAGFVTFFASCLLPLVPTYLAFLSGVALNSEKKKSEIFINSLIFTGGFILVFVLMGASVNSLSHLLIKNRNLFQTIGGIFFILMGFFMLHIFKPSFLLRERRFSLISKFSSFKKINAFFMGLTFGFAWSPCIGPVLGIILFWASQARTVGRGMFLLFTYGLGLAVPFVLIGFFIEKVNKSFLMSHKIGKILNIVSAVIIILVGLLLMTNKLNHINHQLFNMLNLNSLTL